VARRRGRGRDYKEIGGHAEAGCLSSTSRRGKLRILPLRSLLIHLTCMAGTSAPIGGPRARSTLQVITGMMVY
jgi:hypothetical protein